MHVPIKTAITFDLPANRSVDVDFMELEDFIAQLWESKGKDPEMDADGKPVLDAKGEPKVRTLDWADIVSGMQGFIKEQTGTAIKKGEAFEVWNKATKGKPTGEKDAKGDDILGQNVVQKKRQSLQNQAAEPPSSPSSQASTDPRFAED
jgi:hypothetical protein